MALFEEQITDTLETGAPSIKYTGKEGPRPSMQSQEEMMIARQIWDAMGDEEKGQFSNFEEFFASGIWKQILQQMQQDEGQGIASLGPQGPQGQPGIAGLGPRNMEQQMPMPNRMGAQYGGRIGYQEGLTVAEKGPLYIDPDTDIPLHNIEKKFQRMTRDERIDEYFEMLKKIEKYKDMDELDMKGHRFKDFLHWGPRGAGGGGWSEMTEALEYTDRPAAETLYETGEHFNRGGRTGIESLRGGI